MEVRLAIKKKKISSSRLDWKKHIGSVLGTAEFQQVLGFKLDSYWWRNLTVDAKGICRCCVVERGRNDLTPGLAFEK